jgi:hypothetical protein
MQEFLLNTKRQSCTVHFSVVVPGTMVPVFICGYDPLTPNTFFFKSTFLLSNSETVSINCPQSSYFMKVCVMTDGNIPFGCDVMVTPLERVTFDEPWIKYIESWCRRAGILWPGRYTDKGVPFTIDYKRVIWNEQTGRIHSTPARIATDEPVIEASKTKLNSTSVPGRIIIMIHEVSHNFINYDPDNEGEADSHAEQIYDSLGYPAIEKINAFGDIMPDTDDNAQRMSNLISY